jgi:hypothetical protein
MQTILKKLQLWCERGAQKKSLVPRNRDRAFLLVISELGFSCQRINTLFSIHFPSDIHF